MTTQNDAATAWRVAHRPEWKRKNPCNKRWFIELQARGVRDADLERMLVAATLGYLPNDQHAALRQLARMKADDTIDALCMPEWADKAFAWPWKASKQEDAQ